MSIEDYVATVPMVFILALIAIVAFNFVSGNHAKSVSKDAERLDEE